uniref:Cytochrome P450 CYP405A4 n=1 Tax=Heliconius melpomene TaxID=34740 RepID=A0A2Z6JJ42_HELME|nr:TPA_inf: cytochrome P450 CYP405A4 [Heliconius melpomene]
MFFLLLVLLVISLILIQDFVKKRGYKWKKLSEFPGDRPLPLVGNGLDIGFDADEASFRLIKMWEKHGKQNFRLSVGSEDWLMLCEPEDIKVLLNDNFELSKPLERNAAMKPFFGYSVSTSEGERWKSVRKLMTPSFHFKALDRAADDFGKHTQTLFELIDSYEGKSPVNIYTYLKPYMLDMLSVNLFGVEKNYLKNRDHPYIKSSSKMIKIITYNYFSYWRNNSYLVRFTPLHTEMQNIIRDVKQNSSDIITQRRKILNKMIEETKSNNKNIDLNYDTFIEDKLAGGCLLDRFILSVSPNGDPEKDAIINEEITLTLFTGHLTTSMTMCNAMYLMSLYPEVQQKVLDEQKAIFGKDLNRQATTQDLNDMKYLEALIKETIRFIPTIPRIGRQLQKDLKLSDGRVAPAGTSVIVFFNAAARNPRTYTEPEKFMPERFFDTTMHPFAFVPFSAGPRNCVAFRYAWIVLKATLSNIIRRYEILPGPEPKFAFRLITESTNGLHLHYKKRDICA